MWLISSDGITRKIQLGYNSIKNNSSFSKFETIFLMLKVFKKTLAIYSALFSPQRQNSVIKKKNQSRARCGGSNL